MYLAAKAMYEATIKRQEIVPGRNIAT